MKFPGDKILFAEARILQSGYIKFKVHIAPSELQEEEWPEELACYMKYGEEVLG